ncbi:hypothetical protein COBT_002805 [Conglomerata obtusa]
MRKDAHATIDRIKILSECIKEVKVINFKMAAQNVEDEDKVKIGISMASLGLINEVMDDVSSGLIVRWQEIENYLIRRSEQEKSDLIKIKEKEKDFRILRLEREIRCLKEKNTKNSYKRDEFRGYLGKGFGFNNPKIVRCFICG